MRHGRRGADDVRIGIVGGQVTPPAPVDDPPPPAPPAPQTPPVHGDDPVAQARYEAEVARAETERLKKRLDEMSKQVLTEDQRARLQELEAKEREAEEKRLAEKGEFDKWRVQIQDKHAKDLDTVRAEVAEATAKREATEKELTDTLIGLAFSGATELFGPGAKTVMPHDVARAYFAKNVRVEMAKPPHGGAEERRVVVRDANGTVIVDPKTGHPMEFGAAMNEVIMSHPKRAELLRGSGKVGSGSAGGNTPGSEPDLTKLKPQDFKDPEIRARLKRQAAQRGGMQFGPAFDQLESNNKK